MKREENGNRMKATAAGVHATVSGVGGGRRGGKRKFTLIELLVVIAIIAILAGDSISNAYGGDGSSFRIATNRLPPATYAYQMTRHLSATANFLFVDGHADSRTQTFMIQEGNNASSKFYDTYQMFK